jgi:hypothetical protein
MKTLNELFVDEKLTMPPEQLSKQSRTEKAA